MRLTRRTVLASGLAGYVHDVVFTTGIADGGDVWVVASGEADLACRITHIPKPELAPQEGDDC